MARADVSSSGLEVRLREARVAVRQRRLNEAHTLCGSVLATDPTNAEALFLMGRTLQEAGNIPAAVDLLGRASNLDVRRAEPAIYLSRALQEAGLAGDAKAAALVALQRVERERRGAATALALDTLAVVLDRVGEHGRAVAMAKRAVALEPRRAAFWRNLGWAELHQNGIPAARAALRKAVALDPNDHQAIAALVDLDLQTEAANFIPQLERLFWATNDPDRRLLLGHALAKSLEDMGQPERAFDWLVRAKAAKRAAVRYDAARDAALFEAAMATVPMETAA